jgi:hypothetical protein
MLPIGNHSLHSADPPPVRADRLDDVPSSRSTAVVSPRGVLIALLAALGTIHLLVAPGRAHDWRWEGAGLAAIGVLQIGSGLWALVGGRRALLAGAASTVVPLALLVFTRTSGYPFGPFDGVSPTLTSLEYVVIVASVLSSALIGGLLLAGADVLGPPGVRFDTLSPLVVFAAAVPGIAVSGWIDDASYFAGEQHVHSTSPTPMATSLSSDDRTELGRQLVEVRSVASSWPTLADALEDGWTPIGPVASGTGQMVVRSADETSDPGIDSPFALMYLSAESDAPIVGVQYTTWEMSDPPTDMFVGQASMWHLHPTACEIDNDIVVPMDEPITGDRCELVDGSLVDRSSFMLRVWIVPGWENPAGTFAHAHPAL